MFKAQAACLRDVERALDAIRRQTHRWLPSLGLEFLEKDEVREISSLVGELQKRMQSLVREGSLIANVTKRTIALVKKRLKGDGQRDATLQMAADIEAVVDDASDDLDDVYDSIEEQDEKLKDQMAKLAMLVETYSGAEAKVRDRSRLLSGTENSTQGKLLDIQADIIAGDLELAKSISRPKFGESAGAAIVRMQNELISLTD